MARLIGPRTLRPRRASQLCALLELGSNAVRFSLARVTPGVGFRVIAQARAQTRLGSGRPGHLPRDAVEGTIRAAQGFLRQVRNGRNPRIVAVATSAVRDARNRDQLLGRLTRDEGVPVRVLTEREEADLGVTAVLHTLPFTDGLVADLGGASLQLTRLRTGRVAGSRSLPLGAVRLARRFLRHDPPTPRELTALRAEVRRRLRGVLPAARDGDHLVGLGGTARALAGMHLAAHPGRKKSPHGLDLRQPDITALRERLEALPAEARRRIPGLEADRADIILAGVSVLEAIIVRGGYPTLTVCASGVRDGLLFREAFGRARES